MPKGVSAADDIDHMNIIFNTIYYIIAVCRRCYYKNCRKMNA